MKTSDEIQGYSEIGTRDLRDTDVMLHNRSYEGTKLSYMYEALNRFYRRLYQGCALAEPGCLKRPSFVFGQLA